LLTVDLIGTCSRRDAARSDEREVVPLFVPTKGVNSAHSLPSLWRCSVPAATPALSAPSWELSTAPTVQMWFGGRSRVTPSSCFTSCAAPAYGNLSRACLHWNSDIQCSAHRTRLIVRGTPRGWADNSSAGPAVSRSPAEAPLVQRRDQCIGGRHCSSRTPYTIAHIIVRIDE
jgi:hypothetical protein